MATTTRPADAPPRDVLLATVSQLDQAALFGDEEPEWDAMHWQPSDDIEALWMDLASAESIVRAARQLVTRAKALMAAQLPSGRIRLGDDLYYTAADPTTTCDRDALTAFLGEDYPLVVGMAANGSNVRKGALDAIATKRGLKPETVRDTFLSVDRDGPRKLQTVPVSKGPKYAAAMTHGERR